MYTHTCIHLAVWLPTTAAAPTAFSVERPRAPAGARVLRSAGSSLRVAVAMAGGRLRARWTLGNSGKNKQEEEKEEGPFLRMDLLDQARPVLAQFVVWASHPGLREDK
jgi:hypothetical protein